MPPRMLLWAHAAPSNHAATPYLYTRARTSSMMNTHGDFNGTCTREEAMTITPETPTGSCSS